MRGERINVPKLKSTLQMTSLLFAMAMLFCYIAWSLGYEGFVIIGHMDMPRFWFDTICNILLLINISLISGFTLNIYKWKILYFSIPFVIIQIIGVLCGIPASLFTGPISTIALIIGLLVIKKTPYDLETIHIWKITMKKWKLGFARLSIALIVTLLHQWIISKISLVDLTTEISAYQVFRLSINGILLMLLLYCIGGIYHERYSTLRLELVVFPGGIRDDDDCNESRSVQPQSAESVPVDKFERWLVRSVIGVVQIMQWMFILWVCNLDNLFLDALVMTTSFICHGMIISKRKHLKPVILCTLAATAMFYFCARFTISFQYSQFFPIIIGLILTYTLYRVDHQFEIAAKEKHKKDLARIAELEKQIDAAWQRLDELS